MNVFSSIAPIFSGSPTGASTPVAGSGRTPEASGEKPASGDTSSTSKPVEQSSEGRKSDQSSESRSDARENPQGLTDEELKQLTDLKARDREVRAHEAAHQAAGGQYAGAMSFTYQRGPDGAQYAVGGEVPIDVSPVAGDPQATIEKMRVVRAAAMAPAQPSGQDRAVAAQAMQTMLQAQSELAAGEGESRTAESSARVEGSQGDARSARSREAEESYRNVSAMAGDSRYSESVTSLFA
ncbi:putative metalloprotease CJM1_0395 family protein [Marinobacter nauticus]|uniref:putative metalloprotease CJM1_0395 family protein n=1 Tax=Marinobacter nauticus TaxID=2743 RepID=UPI00242E2FFF|nr:putative metalloprotease CJM1_0395 family protein [Marinobacter nauticus]